MSDPTKPVPDTDRSSRPGPTNSAPRKSKLKAVFSSVKRKFRSHVHRAKKTDSTGAATSASPALASAITRPDHAPAAPSAIPAARKSRECLNWIRNPFRKRATPRATVSSNAFPITNPGLSDVLSQTPADMESGESGKTSKNDGSSSSGYVDFGGENEHMTGDLVGTNPEEEESLPPTRPSTGTDSEDHFRGFSGIHACSSAEPDAGVARDAQYPDEVAWAVNSILNCLVDQVGVFMEHQDLRDSGRMGPGLHSGGEAGSMGGVNALAVSSVEPPPSSGELEPAVNGELAIASEDTVSKQDVGNALEASSTEPIPTSTSVEPAIHSDPSIATESSVSEQKEADALGIPSNEPTPALDKRPSPRPLPVPPGPGKSGRHAKEQAQAETELFSPLSPQSDVSETKAKAGANSPDQRSSAGDEDGIDFGAAATTQADATIEAIGSSANQGPRSNRITNQFHTHTHAPRRRRRRRRRRNRHRRRRSRWNELLRRASRLRQHVPIHWSDWVLGYRDTPYHRATVQLAVRAVDGDISAAEMDARMRLLLRPLPAPATRTAHSPAARAPEGAPLPPGTYRHGSVSQTLFAENVAVSPATMAASYRVSTPGEWVNDEPGETESG
ncbi:hypothetical protein K490DRAFT_56168 [Saccharata proteae CBS 121410]|uniref:Uncharacterized protein n=1 Tax=Saccharata proteae CBS 121410 TaxID=1314787 RepID=A0A9P4LXW7_9PEZI|nr:hypothetical protein K490DRAFT_56168 [Saccharata proteae CBS 121410]